MTEIQRARELAGAEFSDMQDADVLAVLEAAEHVMRRPFLPKEASFFKGALRARRTRLAQAAGAAKPAFVPEMYGDMRSAAERRADDNLVGEP